MDKKRIAWITPTSFLDTDIYIVPLLKEDFLIDWYILKKQSEKLDYEKEIKKISASISVRIIDVGKRNRSLSAIKKYFSFLHKVGKSGYNLVYTAVSNYPYYIPLLAATQDKKKVVMAVHNVTVLKGGVRPQFEKLYNAFAIRYFQIFQTYSQGQFDSFKNIAPQKEVHFIPFLPKDYGEATITRRDKRITFLNFGHIREYKRIDVLIQAADLAYETTGIVFKIIIAGACANWDKYAELIKHRVLFDIRIGRVQNKDIPNLFEESDYFIAPYQDIAQSGALMVAINYEKPILASRLKAFEECVADGKTGLLFKPADVEDLSQKIIYVLRNNNEIYSDMKANVHELKHRKFSETVIVQKYKQLFDKVAN